MVACSPPQPSLLFISLDTVRADHCSTYGYTRLTTPNLEEIAKGGVVFEDCYAPMASTAPSHASMFTGLLPLAHGVQKNGLALSPRFVTLAERLSEEGYRTAAVVSSFAVDGKFGLSQGFEAYDDTFPAAGAPNRSRSWEGSKYVGAFEQDAEETTRNAGSWLRESVRDGKPFFLWVHYFDPHWPYAPSPPYVDFFGSDGQGELEAIIARYDAEIRKTDEAIGTLLEILAEEGGDGSTLVVVVGDHGEGLMQHGHMFHGIHLFEEAVRVPFILRWPGELPSGVRLRGPVELGDLAPTVLDLLGVGYEPKDFQGISLASALQGVESLDPARPLLLQRRLYNTEWVHGHRVTGEQYALRSGRWKLTVSYEPGSFELYDLETDPGETTNLADLRPELCSRLAEQLSTLRAAASLAPDPETARVVEEADAERLRALGYQQ